MQSTENWQHIRQIFAQRQLFRKGTAMPAYGKKTFKNSSPEPEA